MKILFLYHDLMNLYGENGNVRVMARHIADQGQSAEVECRTVGDEVDFSQYAFIYAGSGTERNQKKALSHFIKYRESFISAIQGGTVALFTGNACEMLGKRITDGDGRSFEGIGLIPFESVESDDIRYTGDAVCTPLTGGLFRPVVGFINKCSEVTGIEEPIFDMQMGYGNTNKDSGEGFRVNNLFGTHLIGPLLAKNPEFAGMVLRLIGEREGFTVTSKTCEYEEKAYEITLSELNKRINA